MRLTIKGRVALTSGILSLLMIVIGALGIKSRRRRSRKPLQAWSS